jgi:hypothetical protein
VQREGEEGEGMILFQERFVPLILSGVKTVTRRRGHKRWNVGAIHQCYTRMPWGKKPGKMFARVRIVSVSFEDFLGDATPPVTAEDGLLHWEGSTEAESHREGFDSWEDFLDLYLEINGEGSLREPAWRVEFELVESLA